MAQLRGRPRLAELGDAARRTYVARSPTMSDDHHTPAMPIDLLLVRHGESEGNVALEAAKGGDHSMAEDPAYLARSTFDYRLSARGRAQAEAAGEWIRSWMDAEGVGAFDRLYCSPFVRTRETAAHLAIPGAAWQLEPLLRERDFGLWEGISKQRIAELYPVALAHKARNRFLWRPEAGESTPDIDMRCREVMGTLARELTEKRVLCVTHEDVMRTFQFRLEKIPVEEWIASVEGGDGDVPNCGILHYSRRDAAGEVQPRFARVRLVDPAAPEAAQWTHITRPRFSDADLLAQVARVPPLWSDTADA